MQAGSTEIQIQVPPLPLLLPGKLLSLSGPWTPHLHARARQNLLDGVLGRTLRPGRCYSLSGSPGCPAGARALLFSFCSASHQTVPSPTLLRMLGI